MSPSPSRPNRDLATRVADRHLLDRDQLLALVEELHSVIVNQQQTVLRQSAAISDLQLRGGNSKTAAGTGTQASPAPVATPRRAATAVAGSNYTIVFDGGSLGNPGKGYGSYQIVGPSGIVAEQSPKYGNNVTNNQAEFMTLIQALENMKELCGSECQQTSLAIRGDSQLVLNTIAGKWKARHPGLIPLHERATELLRQFGKKDIKWQPRSESVAILGH